MTQGKVMSPLRNITKATTRNKTLFVLERKHFQVILEHLLCIFGYFFQKNVCVFELPPFFFWPMENNIICHIISHDIVLVSASCFFCVVLWCLVLKELLSHVCYANSFPNPLPLAMDHVLAHHWGRRGCWNAPLQRL